MTCFGSSDTMDLDMPDVSDDSEGSASASCSICLEVVLDRGERSLAKLHCGHEFHLDCIGSAFNAKGAMQCPNCRKVEKGRWLFAHGLHSSTDFDIDGWITEDIYDLSYSDLPLGYQWCPFSFTQLASLFEDIDTLPNSYHELLGGSTYGDRLSSSGSSHVCPFLALHGFPHPLHTAPTTSDHVPENSHYHRHSAGLAGHPPAEMFTSHSFSSIEPQNHHWQQQQQPPQLSMSLAANSDHQYGLRLPRADTSNHQQRPGSFVHSHPLPHGSVHSRSGSNLIAGTMAPSVLGEVRAHATRSSVFAPIRSMPRGLAVVSTSTSADTSGFYGFAVPNSTSRSIPDTGRQFDQIYGWGRDNFAPLPWIPVDGESRWWGPFNPNQPPSGSFHQRGTTTNERVAHSRSENGYHQRVPPPPPSRMPPPPPSRMPPPPPPPYM